MPKKGNRGQQNGRGGPPQDKGGSQPQTHYQEMFSSYEQSKGRGGGGYRGNHQDHSGSRNGDQQQDHQRNYNPNSYQRQQDEQRQREITEEQQKATSNKSRHHHNDQHGTQHNDNRQKSSQSGAGPGPTNSENSVKLNVTQCPQCEEIYNGSRLPRISACGHTFCTDCLAILIKRNPKCPSCQKKFREKKLDDFPVNFAVRNLLDAKMNTGPDKKSEVRNIDSLSCRPKSDFRESSQSKSPKRREEKMEPRATVEKSPHDSKCLEIGVPPTSHCATCLKWVCDKCGVIDHDQRKGCYLIPKKQALLQMTGAQVDGANGTCETMENIVTELKTYDERLDAFALTMQAAFESIAVEKKRVNAMMEEGVKRKKDLKATVAALQDNQNLPDALAGLSQLDNLSNKNVLWATENCSRTLDQAKVNQIVKGILFSTVQMKMMANNDPKAAIQVLAQHRVEGLMLSSCFTVNGGQILLHALEKVDSIATGTRAIPLTSVLACLDPGSALTFLEIGWGGSIKGCIFIRLLGDTQRGRQFVALCTGKEGPSFRGTSFHRVWWRDLPGEHIWGGDYNKGDGSGGKPILKLSDKEKSSVPAGRCLAIEAGLVAGSYEKTNVSSIFRIYTKSSKSNEKSSYLSNTPEVVRDEAAFGIVEYGLNVLEDAVKQKDIKDVTIYNCGIVIEP